LQFKSHALAGKNTANARRGDDARESGAASGDAESDELGPAGIDADRKRGLAIAAYGKEVIPEPVTGPTVPAISPVKASLGLKRSEVAP
jgi:hypothetical protein